MAAIWTVLALAFAVVWTYAVYREDRRNPEPVWMVVLATLSGVGAFYAADRLQQLLVPGFQDLYGSIWVRLKLAFLISAPTEETLKLLGILIFIWPWTHFDETVDGIVYGAAAGAGFALVENLEFMRDQPAVVLARGPIGTGVHVLFSALAGGALGFSGHLKLRWRRALEVGVGLALAILAHGLFNLVTFSAGLEITTGVARAFQIAILLSCAVFLRWRIGVALKLFPFRIRTPRPAAPKG